MSSSSHAKLENVTVNCSSTVESPCLREASKVPSALEIAMTPYSYLVGMFYRLSKNVSPSPDSMVWPWVIGIMLWSWHLVITSCFLLYGLQMLNV